MASYTMELKNYIEMFSQNETLSIREQIEKGRTKLFDFDYPIFDSNYKKVFETHFIRKFYMREIGFETEGLFKFQLETWLLINMPFFNKMFESELMVFDPLTNTKLDVTTSKTNNKTQTGTKDSTVSSTTDGTNNSTNTQDGTGELVDDNFNRHLESNNPDSRLILTSNDGEGVIEYASKIDENNENNTKTSTTHNTSVGNDVSSIESDSTQNDQISNNINETDDYIESRIGKIGDQSYSKMLNEYRDSLLRIENKIFNEMQELFMLVY